MSMKDRLFESKVTSAIRTFLDFGDTYNEFDLFDKIHELYQEQCNSCEEVKRLERIREKLEKAIIREAELLGNDNDIKDKVAGIIKNHHRTTEYDSLIVAEKILSIPEIKNALQSAKLLKECVEHCGNLDDEIEKLEQSPVNGKVIERKCPECNGQGQTATTADIIGQICHRCTKCNGTGRITRKLTSRDIELSPDEYNSKGEVITHLYYVLKKSLKDEGYEIRKEKAL